MSPIAPALAVLSAEIAVRTERLGREVDVAALGITDRSGHLPLAPPGLRSPNGACRLIQARDGWIALNLARDEDRDLVPAWLECGFDSDPWTAVAALAGSRRAGALVARAELLGLPVAQVGEAAGERLEVPVRRLSEAAGAAASGPLRVVDLSALWAGPLCGAVLAAMGAEVLKVESVRRPDPTREHTPEFHQRLNGGKEALRLDLAEAGGQARLGDEIAKAQVLITSARPRGLESIGLSMEAILARNPGLIWIAVTGYGWARGQRVAFGDDAAAAGGLVRWEAGQPRFLGDALADPITGLAAAAAVLKALEAKTGGVLIDAALARCAAGAVSLQPAAA